MTMPDKNTEVEKISEELYERLFRHGVHASWVKDALHTAYLAGIKRAVEEMNKKIDDTINDGQFRMYAVSSFPDDRNGIYLNREDLRAGLKQSLIAATQAITNEIKEREG